MKLKKLVKDFDELLDSIERQRQSYDKRLKVYRRRLKEKREVLLKRLKTADNKADRKRFKRELNAVERTYALLRA